VSSGVRYVCDTLSLVLFTAFINLIIVRLKDCGFGCALNSMYIGCIMYAGDIIWLSATAVQWQGKGFYMSVRIWEFPHF